VKSSLAQCPPMGWNSWDCFGVNVTEAEVRANADYMAKNLKQYGWEYVVVDLGWYAPEATKENYKEVHIPFLIDSFGRLVPDEKRFPSARGGKGFKPLADYIHSLGLKFGIHIMRGIPWIAAHQDTPIMGSVHTAKQVANPSDQSLWYNSMYGIDCTLEGGRAYYKSILELYASWDVDFIKADDLGSWDGEGKFSHYRVDEVEALSYATANCGRDIVLSLSPGAAYIGDAYHLRRHAHMWRISADFWDEWEALKRQFQRCHEWSTRVVPGHWPDADMLPLGKIGIRGEIGAPRQTNFTKDEQYTLMTLWCIFRNPLMFGGHFPESDELSISLITNKEALKVNQQSKNNRQLFRTESSIAWRADATDDSKSYLAIFNISDAEQEIKVLLQGKKTLIRDLWNKKDIGNFADFFTQKLPPHGAGLFSLNNKAI
ncbi:MAG: glycoside hydrolase family 27 protein, partial [Bacteroidota bacterium]